MAKIVDSISLLPSTYKEDADILILKATDKET